MKRAVVLAVMLCACFGRCLVGAHAQTVSGEAFNRVSAVPRTEVDSWLKEEIQRSGGDISSQRYHFILAFSTGHFGRDPVNGIAMRRLAYSLLNNTFAAGDEVTPAAWEMKLWDVGSTVTLGDSADGRADVVNHVQQTTKPGSAGGHDVERALYDILSLSKVVSQAELKSTIVLLITNSNQSQEPSGGHTSLFGGNNPLLVDVMRHDGFRTPPERHSFTLQGDGRPTTVDVTALFPEHLVGLAGAPTGPRYPTFARDTWQPSEDKPAATETLPNPAGGAGAAHAGSGGPGGGVVPAPSHGLSIWIYILIALLLLAIIAFVIMQMTRGPKRKPQTGPPVPVVPKGVPIPGSVMVVIATTETNLEELTTISRWSIVASGGALTLDDGQKLEGSRVATMAFDEKRRLSIKAETGAQFVEIHGTNAAACDSRQLLIAPGERALCRLSSSELSTPVRLEVAYKSERKA